jgi:hypothetical protein
MASICINEKLTDDELRSILSKLENDKDKEIFGLVCKRWLGLQSNGRKRLAARAGPHMLQKMAARFSRLIELDLSQSVSRSFYPGVTDSDLAVIADGFRCLKVLNLQNCKGKITYLVYVFVSLNLDAKRVCLFRFHGVLRIHFVERLWCFSGFLCVNVAMMKRVFFFLIGLSCMILRVKVTVLVIFMVYLEGLGVFFFFLIFDGKHDHRRNFEVILLCL